MSVLVAFLIGAVLVGGSGMARPLRERPWLLVVVCTIVAASFYRLGAVL